MEEHAQFVTDGSKYARACYTGPYTANHIEEALVKKIKTLKVNPVRESVVKDETFSDRVKIIENQMIIELLLSENKERVVGAIGLDEKGPALDESSDGLTLFKAKTIILATGGPGRAYRDNVYPERMTGDGWALAYQAGAELVNVEFIQIGLCSGDDEYAVGCRGHFRSCLLAG